MWYSVLEHNARTRLLAATGTGYQDTDHLDNYRVIIIGPVAHSAEIIELPWLVRALPQDLLPALSSRSAYAIPSTAK